MDEPIMYCPWALSTFQKESTFESYAKLARLHNALILDDKDEFLRLIKDPKLEPIFPYQNDGGLLSLSKVTVNMILRNDSPQIAMAVLSGETRGIIDDDDNQLVFKDGWTPLHLASVATSPRLIKCLIEKGDPVDVTCDYYAPLNLKHATPLDLALKVIDSGYEHGFKTVERPWTPRSSIFELLHYVCEWQLPCLEVVRLLVQNTQDKERVRKAIFAYADEGNLVKLAALFLAAPDLFLSSSLGDGGMSSIEALYLNLNSLKKTTNIQHALLLLLDVFALVGHMLIAFLRVNDPKVFKVHSYFDQYKIGFFLREAADKKLGIPSRDGYLLSFFKPVSHVYHPPSSPPSKFDTRITCQLKVLRFEMKRRDIDIDYVNRMIPSLELPGAALLREAIENKLSKMPNICNLFEGMTRISKQSSYVSCARSVEQMKARSFCTEAANAERRSDFKIIFGNVWERRVMNPTKLESFFSAVRLSHFPMIAKRLIK